MELALTKPTMAKGINIKRMLAIKRAKAIKREAEMYFHAQVHHCCRVSANNHNIAYLIERVGIFNGPKVELITRPNEVVLFSKWRTEALKAYGNAIVPQVMYRIFQAIEQS